MKILCFTILTLTATLTNAAQLMLEPLYQAAGVEGTLMIQSLDGKQEYAHNAHDVTTGYIPASTFKIPNTLIALEKNIIRNADDPIPWDGVQRGYAPWNQDQTLASAFKVSCVWCYQRFARKIGPSTYPVYLQAFQYGNQKTGSDVTTFWLEGDLRISVRQQIAFLRKVYNQSLEMIQPRNYQVLKEIMLMEDNDSYRLWAKTGWQGKDGWYVGYLQDDAGVWLFAHHLHIASEADLPLRRELVMKAFRQLNIIAP